MISEKARTNSAGRASRRFAVPLRVIVFFATALVLTIALGGIQEATGLFTEYVTLGQWGPGLAAVVVLLIFRKDRHQISIVDRSIPAWRYLLAVVVPAGGALLAYLINSLLISAVEFGDLAGIPWPALAWMPLGAIGEEVGWRGYLHKRVNSRPSGLASSVIVGILWGLWHVGNYQNGPVYMAFFVLLMVSYTFVMYALIAGTGFNVLLAAVFHLTINVTSLFSYAFIDSTAFIVVNSLVWMLIAAVIVAIRDPGS
jgi:membrane protease YdiL (CAAX protease family)